MNRSLINLRRCGSDVTANSPLAQLDRDLKADWKSRRDRVLSQHAADLDDVDWQCPRLPESQSFYALPEQLLLAYERHREESELGHVFRIANSLHDRLDAIVVLGPPNAILSVQAITAACCDPYHNEMSRADRGSKPRIYFADTEMDNDFIQSLVWRLARNGYGDVRAEQRWGIVAIDDQQSRSQVIPLLRFLAGQMPTWDDAVSGENASEIPAPITIITAQPDDWATSIGGFGPPFELLHSNSLLSGTMGALAPASLLPAAFLGLDVIQLLVGAAAINKNFAEGEWNENLSLQLAGLIEQRQLDCIGWSNSFDGLLRWWIKAIETATEASATWARSGAINPTRSANRPAVTMHWLAEPPRTDPVQLWDTSGDLISVEQLKRQRFESVVSASATPTCDQIELVLPGIDTHPIGQVMQLGLILAELARERSR
ncbi:hypothetical protein [Rhodopirellula sp. MGV]|uniref:hypothetical protein n=1 Tax=Rhodopirellula sp. MGV TaxID=2023130 RepID=UPI000B96EE81|nr:hypothetical protein [Rhodopirellula sp. MGV]OYP35162.1 hypothetical protein CGZ80_12230 [Rhodopirellula sp. MGV]PNY37822.1 hypothetical protein C2E31_06070 [Rhodopirellula baltica]